MLTGFTVQVAVTYLLRLQQLISVTLTCLLSPPLASALAFHPRDRAVGTDNTTHTLSLEAFLIEVIPPDSCID